MLDWITLGISLAAILTSIVTPIFEYWWNKKLNRQNLAAEYFMQVYEKFLFEEIPKAKSYIHYSNKEINGVDEMLDVLREMRQKSLYYKSSDNEFYKNLLTEIQKLEDYLVITYRDIDDEMYIKFYNKVDSYIDAIYKRICDKCFKMV